MKDIADALARLNELGRPDLAEPIHFLIGERDGLMKALASAKTVIESKDKAYSLIQQRWDAMRAKASTVDSERACNEMLTAEVDALRARVAELEPMAECAAIMAVCGYFSRMRGPVAMVLNDVHPFSSVYKVEWYTNYRDLPDGTKLYAGSAPAPAAQMDNPDVMARATVYARDIVTWLHRDHYADNTAFESFDDLLGLLSQIDNMICGWKEHPAAQAVDVDAICNAYESGVGHRGRPTANVNPYRECTPEHEAYAIGAKGEAAQAEENVADDVALEALQTLRGIAGVTARAWELPRQDFIDEFLPWAQSRARYAVAKIEALLAAKAKGG